MKLNLRTTRKDTLKTAAHIAVFSLTLFLPVFFLLALI